MIEIHTFDRAEPVAVVTADGILRSPADAEALRRAACPHVNRIPVTLLVPPYEHVADLCADCDKRLEPS